MAAPRPEAEERWIVLGLITAPYGVRGWVRVKPYTQTPDGLSRYPTWWIGVGGEWRPMRVEGYRVHGRGGIAKLEGCLDRSEAEAYARCEVAVPRSVLPETGEGEFYWVDLIGLRVESLDGSFLGEVSGILETGAHPVIRVVSERERLIPFVEQVVKEVDLERRVMRVDWGADF